MLFKQTHHGQHEHAAATMRGKKTASQSSQHKAKFTEGSIRQHVRAMAITGSIGLIALFAVDLVDMYFLSLLGERSLAAAVGYAGSILFFTSALSIGLSIAAGALVGKAIGAEQEEHAAEYMWHTFMVSVAITTPVAIGAWFYAGELLHMVGATGQTQEYAITYLRYLLPSLPILSVAMCANAILRAVGDAKRSMYATLFGGLANAVCDPLFMFGLDMHIAGAALASVVARCTILYFSFAPLIRIYNFKGCTMSLAALRRDLPTIWHIAIPAILTNLATPIGNSYVIKVLAEFGDSVVAGFSIIGRVSMVAFAVLFALSGAVGPIIAQNYGAGIRERVIEALKESARFTVIYVVLVSLLLLPSAGIIINIFGIVGEGVAVVETFVRVVSWTYIFSGFVFVANAAFNSLDLAKYATLTNILRTTVFTMPFVYIGAKLGGPSGVLVGQAIGSICIGVIAFVGSLYIVRRMPMDKEV